jgi:hypothetical protein
LLRYDEETLRDISDLNKISLLSYIEKNINTIDDILMIDYKKGVITKDLAQVIIGLANSHNVPVYVDTKKDDLSSFSGCSIIKPNKYEFEKIRLRYAPDYSMEDACKIICEKLKIQRIVITAGNETFHGKGQETKPGESSKLREKPQPIEVTATIQASFDEVTSSPSKTAKFKATFTNDVAKAANISPSLINITDIKPGSVVVVFQILPDVSSSSAPSPAAVAMDLAVQAADPRSALRQGTLTSSVSVALPVGVQEMAGQKSTTTAGAVPKYLSTCEPKSYSSSLDMKRCYTCCNFLCQTGPEVPQDGGNVWFSSEYGINDRFNHIEDTPFHWIHGNRIKS